MSGAEREVCPVCGELMFNAQDWDDLCGDPDGAPSSPAQCTGQEDHEPCALNWRARALAAEARLAKVEEAGTALRRLATEMYNAGRVEAAGDLLVAADLLAAALGEEVSRG